MYQLFVYVEIAQLGERYIEELNVPDSIPCFGRNLCSKSHIVYIAQEARWTCFREIPRMVNLPASVYHRNFSSESCLDCFIITLGSDLVRFRIYWSY